MAKRSVCVMCAHEKPIYLWGMELQTKDKQTYYATRLCRSCADILEVFAEDATVTFDTAVDEQAKLFEPT